MKTIKAKYKIGDKVMMTADAIENYGFKYEGKTFKVSHVAVNKEQHPGFDTGVNEALYDLDGLSFSLYDYELYRA